MNELFPLWLPGSRVNASLIVSIDSETENAIKFRVADNAKLFFWVPKKAVKFDNLGVANLAFWFTPGQFIRGIFDRYANHYNR